MQRREQRARIVAILEGGELEEFTTLMERYPPHTLLSPLFSALCHASAKVRGNAVYAFGIMVARVAEDDLEAARVVMRRFLWSLNEESGGIGWGAPEAMARILGASDLLRREYLHLLCSYMRGDGPEPFQDGNYLELPMLQRGLLAGIGDLCRDFPKEMADEDISGDVLAYLDSPDQQVIGLAIRCLGFLGEPQTRDRIAGFLDHPGPVDLFEAGKECAVTVGELAAQALERIGGVAGCSRHTAV